MSSNIFVAGAGGFIGGHLVNQLVAAGHSVVTADIKDWYQFNSLAANRNMGCDLRLRDNCYELSAGADRIYNLACNMGGMGFIKNNHSLCMESVLIQTHMLQAARDRRVPEILYSSSACIYPQEIQSEIKDSASQGLKEADAYPANLKMGMGGKNFSEIITNYFQQDFGLDVRICRYHCAGPFGTWRGGREKAPAAVAGKL